MKKESQGQDPVAEWPKDALLRLQHNHAHTGRESHKHVHRNLRESHTAEVRDTWRRTSRARRAGAAAAATATTATAAAIADAGRGRSDGALTVRASLRDERCAVASWLGGSLGCGRAGEVAGAGCVALGALLVVVHVKSPTELLFRVAHAIRAVVAGSSVGLDAIADGVAEAADNAKESAILVLRNIVRHASQGLVHAFAEFLVGGRWQSGSGLPCTADGWTRCLSCVCGSVGSRVDSGGGDSGDLG